MLGKAPPFFSKLFASETKNQVVKVLTPLPPCKSIGELYLTDKPFQTSKEISEGKNFLAKNVLSKNFSKMKRLHQNRYFVFRSALIFGTTSSPFGTGSDPVGRKSFCTSIIKSARFMADVNHIHSIDNTINI